MHKPVWKVKDRGPVTILLINRLVAFHGEIFITCKLQRKNWTEYHLVLRTPKLLLQITGTISLNTKC